MTTSWRRRRPILGDGTGTRSQKRALTASILCAALALSGVAGAQTSADLDRARTLFREGVALSAANDWSAALAKFKAVAQVKMTPQVAFNIAECEEHLGRLLSALGNYRIAASEAEAAKATDVAAQVDERIAALEARIPKLVILRGEGAETAKIELDGVELGGGQIGGELPVDPGPHVIVGKIGDKEASRESVDLAEKSTKTISIVIDTALLEMKKPVDEPKKDEPKVAPPPDKTLAYVVTGAGGVSLAAGVVFMILRSGTISDLDEACGGDATCPKSAESTADSGKLYTGLAEVTIPLGVIGVAAGVYMLVSSPAGGPPGGPSSPEPAAAAGRLVPRSPAKREAFRFVTSAPGADVAGASLVGRF